MIDTHAHLEQRDYRDDLEDVIGRCKAAGMKGIVSVATHPRDFERGIEIHEKNRGFVFLAAGVHPEYIKEISKEQMVKSFAWMRENEKHLVGIGEQGLDYFWVKEQEWREKQKELFVKCIELSKELDKVLIVHTRDAHDEVIEILEKHRAERVHLHMWGGNHLVKKLIDHGWYISVGPVAEFSKKHGKVIRDMPIEMMMLETDSPWFGKRGSDGKRARGEPTNIKIPAKCIAEIKGMDFDEVWKACGENAKRLYRLKI